MSESEHQTRLRAMRGQIRQSGADALLTTSRENVQYLTGFSGHDSWVLVLGRACVLITDSRYTEQAQKECTGCRIVERSGPMVEAIGRQLKRYSSVHVLGLEENCLLSAFRQLKKKLPVRVKAVGDIGLQIRRCKNESELRRIRQAARVAWDALSESLDELRVGMSESEWAGRVDYAVRRQGCVPGFETIVAFGANGSRPHHQPGARKLHQHDTILIDFGVSKMGYSCDLTRCFAVNSVSRQYARAYRGVCEAQRAAIRAVGPDVKVVDVDAAARKVLEEYDLPQYGHGTGHGLGLAVHEIPIVARTSKDVLQPGDLITIEPGVYIPGKLGIRIEDDVVVTENGCKGLTRDWRFNTDPLRPPLIECT